MAVQTSAYVQVTMVVSVKLTIWVSVEVVHKIWYSVVEGSSWNTILTLTVIYKISALHPGSPPTRCRSSGTPPEDITQMSPIVLTIAN